MTPVWSRRVADEFWSGPVTPLTFSLLAETMEEHMVRRVLRQAGQAVLASEPVLRRHASHVYVNGALLGGVVRLLPPTLRSDGVLQLLPAEIRASLPPTSPAAATLRAVEMVARFALREPAWSPWQRAAAFERAADAVRGRFETLPPPAREPAAIVAEMREVRAALGAFLETVSWGVVFAYVFYHLLHEICRRWAPGHDPDAAALTVGLPGVASLAAAHEIAALGRLLGANPGGSVTGAASGPAGEAFRALLSRHGHRLIGRDLACPSWREAPDVVLRLATRTAGDRRGTTDGERRAAAGAEQRRLDATARVERAVRAGVAGPLRLGVFRATLAAAQRYYVVRENMRYYADFFLARLRALALAAGAHLVRQGTLADPSDVFLLDMDELADACAGRGHPAALVVERRAALAHDTAAPPPVQLEDATAYARVAAAGTSPGGADVLTGECAAPGACRGIARVVHTPDDFAAFTAGDIMVAAYTDPGWTPILELACGLVLDAGGQLSHGAIVARELGIPALVNVTDATRTIATGDTLELDATNGVVRIVAACLPSRSA